MKLNEVKGDHGWKVEIVKDDQSISRLWIVDRQMRIGRCPVYTGGIAGVGTNPEFRNQGLSRRVLEASVELMRRENYDASFLFGIRDFYHKFGFGTCMPERLLHLDTRDAERAEKSLAMRSMRRSDFAQIARLYNRDNAERTASATSSLIAGAGS
jgi:predicted acetyltransferase